MVVPQRGEKKKLLDLVRKNVEIGFFGDRIKVEELKRCLHLPGSPGRGRVLRYLPPLRHGDGGLDGPVQVGTT